MKQEPREPNPGEFVRGVGHLLRVEDVTPPPPPKAEDFIFEQVTARIEIRTPKGKVIKSGPVLTEFYGQGTATESAIEEAKRYIDEYAPNVIAVVEVREQYRFRPTTDRNFYDRQFCGFSMTETGSRHGLPDPAEKEVWRSDQVEKEAA